jgi:hypothetical protein
MSKLVWIALLGLALAGCASDSRSTRGGSTSGGSATTAPSGSNQDMKGSSNTAPGAEGDRQPPKGSSSGSTAPRSTY